LLAGQHFFSPPSVHPAGESASEQSRYNGESFYFSSL